MTVGAEVQKMIVILSPVSASATNEVAGNCPSGSILVPNNKHSTKYPHSASSNLWRVRSGGGKCGGLSTRSATRGSATFCQSIQIRRTKVPTKSQSWFGEETLHVPIKLELTMREMKLISCGSRRSHFEPLSPSPPLFHSRLVWFFRSPPAPCFLFLHAGPTRLRVAIASSHPALGFPSHFCSFFF